MYDSLFKYFIYCLLIIYGCIYESNPENWKGKLFCDKMFRREQRPLKYFTAFNWYSMQTSKD